MSTKSAALQQVTSSPAGIASEAQAVTEAPASRISIILALLALYFIWGSTYLAISYVVETIPPFLSAGVRFIIAGGLMFAFLRWRGHPMPTLKQWRGAFIVGVLLLLGGNGLVSVAEQSVPSGLAALMVATTPIWAALFAGLWGRWPVRLEWVGLAIGFVGVVLLNLEGDMQANPWAAGLLVLAAGSWALGSVISGRLEMPKGFMASAAQMLTAGFALLIVGLLAGQRFDQAPSTESLIGLVYLIFIGGIIGYSAYGFLLRNVRPSLATSYAYVNPAVAVALGVALRGENITWIGVAAMGVILAGVGVLALVRNKSGATSGH